MATVTDHETEVLKGLIFSPTFLSPAVRAALLSLLWPPSGHGYRQEDPEDFRAYFVYFQQQCRQDMSGSHAMQTYADFALILGIIRGNLSASLAEVRALIKASNPALIAHERKLSMSIELVVRLWLMISVRILMPVHRNDLEVSLPWPDDQSLADTLRHHLSQPAASPLTVADKFSPYFNVIDMKNIANFRVLWTNNLGDHLSLRGTSIYMFYHVSALERLKNSLSCNDFLPAPVIDETIATISLLIPPNMANCNAWLTGQIGHVGLDPGIFYREAAGRSRGAYVYWAERLLAISESFDRSKPSNPIQWWRDRRDMGQWWGFWLVMTGILLTVTFGLIQSVTGILQVIKPST